MSFIVWQTPIIGMDKQANSTNVSGRKMEFGSFGGREGHEPSGVFWRLVEINGIFAAQDDLFGWNGTI